MLAALVVHLKANYGNLTSGLKIAQTHVAATVSKISSLTVGMAKAAVVGGAMAALGGIAWGGQLAAEAEQAQVAFGTLLKSDEVAKQVLGDLQAFAAATPFEMADLRAGAQNLLAFGVSSGDLMSKMQMLGDIAAGTGKPIGDFAQIFGKVKATGKVSLETLNQLAERGVPIYSALADQMGVNREQMLKMISAGKVGFPDLDAALASTTAAGGVFAGGMLRQSTTVNGLISTLKDNVGMAFQELSTILMDAFDFKGILQAGISFAERAKGWFTDLTIVIHSFAAMATAYFEFCYAVWSGILSSLLGSSTITFRDVLEIIITAMAMAEFGFLNWQDVGLLVLMKIQLGFIAFVGEFQHFFTTSLPHYLTYFADNFGSIFLNAFDYVTTIFINLGQNIRSVMKEIWDFIASGGTDSMEIAWTPLTDGFVNTLKEMEDVPARAIGPVESALQQQVDSLGDGLKTGMDALVQKRLAQLDNFGQGTQAAVAGVTLTPETPPEDPAAGGGPGGSKGAGGALKKGSAEAFSAIFAAMRGSQNGKEAQALKAQQAAAKAAAQTAVNTDKIATALQGGATIAVVESL